VRLDSSDLKSGQVSEVNGDLALSGGRRATECDVSWLDKREETTCDSQLWWRHSGSSSSR